MLILSVKMCWSEVFIKCVGYNSQGEGGIYSSREHAHFLYCLSDNTYEYNILAVLKKYKELSVLLPVDFRTL